MTVAGPDAVVLDLDGVLVDSEEAWDAARRELVAERGGTWKDGATHEMLGARWPLGLASSSNVPVIALVLEETGLDGVIRAWVSSEEVARGKPAPDVYLEAARRLGVDPARCVAVEDSSNGLRSAAAAGMAVVAVPMRAFPPAPDALALAAVEVDGIANVTPDVVERAFAGHPIR